MKRFTFLLLGALATSALASSPIRSATDKQLIARWNKQAEGYDKGFVLRDCTSTKVPNSTSSFLFCPTSGDAGAVFFRRKAGRFENVEYSVSGHPLRAASMFMRFVRDSGSGNMADVGGQLMGDAKSAGMACTIEPNAQVCAYWSLGTWELEAK